MRIGRKLAKLKVRRLDTYQKPRPYLFPELETMRKNFEERYRLNDKIWKVDDQKGELDGNE